MIDTDAVCDEYDEFGGSRPEGILRCLHQTKIAVTFLEVQFFVPVDVKYRRNETTKRQLRQILVNYELFRFVNGLNPGVSVVRSGEGSFEKNCCW